MLLTTPGITVAGWLPPSVFELWAAATAGLTRDANTPAPPLYCPWKERGPGKARSGFVAISSVTVTEVLAVPIGFVSGANVTSVDEIVKFVATAPASTPNETEAMGSLSD